MTDKKLDQIRTEQCKKIRAMLIDLIHTETRLDSLHNQINTNLTNALLQVQHAIKAYESERAT